MLEGWATLIGAAETGGRGETPWGCVLWPGEAEVAEVADEELVGRELSERGGVGTPEPEPTRAGEGRGWGLGEAAIAAVVAVDTEEEEVSGCGDSPVGCLRALMAGEEVGKEIHVGV